MLLFFFLMFYLEMNLILRHFFKIIKRDSGHIYFTESLVNNLRIIKGIFNFSCAENEWILFAVGY